MSENKIKCWVPFTEEDLTWLDDIIKAQYYSYPDGQEGDILKNALKEQCKRMKRTAVLDDLV